MLVGVQSEVWVSSCVTVGIVGLNPTEGMDVCLSCLSCGQRPL
jgi:hypothetical protein